MHAVALLRCRACVRKLSGYCVSYPNRAVVWESVDRLYCRCQRVLTRDNLQGFFNVLI